MLKSISNENVFDKNLTNKRIYLKHFQMYPYWYELICSLDGNFQSDSFKFQFDRIIVSCKS